MGPVITEIEDRQAARKHARKLYGRLFRTQSGLRKIVKNAKPGSAVIVALTSDTAGDVFEQLSRYGGSGRIIVYSAGRKYLEILDVLRGSDGDDEQATRIGEGVTMGTLLASQREFKQMADWDRVFSASERELAEV